MLFLVLLTLLLQTLSCRLSHSPSVHSCLRKSGFSIHLTGLPGTTFNSVLGCRYPVHFDKTKRYFKLHEKSTLQREDFPDGSAGRESACSAGDAGSSLGWEDPLEEEVATHSWEIQDRGAWWAAVHGATKSEHDWARTSREKKQIFLFWPSWQRKYKICSLKYGPASNQYRKVKRYYHE